MFGMRKALHSLFGSALDLKGGDPILRKRPPLLEAAPLEEHGHPGVCSWGSAPSMARFVKSSLQIPLVYAVIPLQHRLEFGFAGSWCNGDVTPIVDLSFTVCTGRAQVPRCERRHRPASPQTGARWTET
jgi:hypothetical protein